MFKKRTRPASVRKALEDDESPLTSELSSGAATPTAEGYVLPHTCPSQLSPPTLPILRGCSPILTPANL